MEAILAYGFVSILVTGIVQYVKKNTAHNPMYLLAVFSIVGASLYVGLSQTPYWESIVETTLVVAGTANLIYNVLKPFFKNA